MSVEWEDIEKVASQMFNIWASGGDFVFAKECWVHLAEAGLTDDDTAVTRTETLLRLVVLRQIIADFSAAKWGENAETEITYLVEGLAIDSLCLGLLAAPHLEHSGALFEDEYELREAALAAVADALKAETFDCIRTAYGGQTALYRRLSAMAGGGDVDYNDQEYDFEANGNDLNGFEFSEHGRR
ncbi:hypothetical protein [Rhizobium sp. CSW-27]|uniref:hypothetical protein n=1 Tax=Rhizobium sp. CSW-27 TaxID=2839985 RepID=UPI001C022697|nr:hypothetical protein [Rhizobium sp. CSW-27]MBT9373329.1 hypothetical protein [Rhizobium sp. CSW-27]